MDLYAQIAEKIIEGQEAIIGPVAIEQANQVQGLKLDWDKHTVAISGDAASVIDKLVEVYKQLFGQISVEVSKQAVANLIGQLGPNALPDTLK